MNDFKSYFETLYKNFDERKIDLVIENMTDDVEWANGMEGGFVHGRQAVKDYWTRQFAVMSSNVTPMEIEAEQGKIFIKVHQVVHDLQGKLLADEIVGHIFELEHDKISRFTIAEK
ncbi:MAG: hypothetical protein JWP81_1195 [Ferruginibacter sp.]|nr:hypothetical protein [Ferruginibacter sp.]